VIHYFKYTLHVNVDNAHVGRLHQLDSQMLLRQYLQVFLALNFELIAKNICKQNGRSLIQ